MPNTKHNADIVITGFGSAYRVWWKDEVIATADEVGLHLIVRGALANDLTIYDAVKGQWLSGTVAQLDDGVFTDETPGEGYRYRDHAGQGEA